MTSYLKAISLSSLLCCLSILNALAANEGGYSEHEAWGGNGGWWGGGNSDFYGEYGWPNYNYREDDYRAYYHYPHYYRCPHGRDYVYHNGRYHSSSCSCVPYHDYEYNDSVPGGALYFNAKE